MRVNRLFFWVTGTTTVCGLFLFVFGISALAYFLTGDNNSDMYAVIKIMEQLPDPRTFISDNLRIYNRMISFFQDIKLTQIVKVPQGNILFTVLLTLADTIYSFFTWLITVVVTAVVGIIFFPIYCVYFAYQTVGALLQIIGVTVPSLPVWQPLASIGI